MRLSSYFMVSVQSPSNVKWAKMFRCDLWDKYLANEIGNFCKYCRSMKPFAVYIDKIKIVHFRRAHNVH